MRSKETQTSIQYLRSSSIQLEHYCSVDSCISILSSGRFRPLHGNPLAADSGINCFVIGGSFNRSQHFAGTGAKLIIEWLLEARKTPREGPYPLEANVLHIQERWRAFIPPDTSKRNVRVIDIIIETQELSWKQKAKLWFIKRKLRRSPLYLHIDH